MQAWAGFAQAGAVVFVAWKGANVFASWRRQKIEERRIDIAERILVAAYRASRALDGIRNPAMFGGETERAEKKLRDDDYPLDAKPDGQRSRIITSQGILNRISDTQAEWDALFEVMPTAAALFGKDLELAIENIIRQKQYVSVYARAYSDNNGNDEQFRKKVERAIWQGVAQAYEEPDEVDVAVAESIAKIEQTLLPVVRADGNGS